MNEIIIKKKSKISACRVSITKGRGGECINVCSNSGKFTKFLVSGELIDLLYSALGDYKKGLSGKRYEGMDEGMFYLKDKLQVACAHGFTFVSEMMHTLSDGGWNPVEIGEYLDMTGDGVKYHLKKLGYTPDPHGGSRAMHAKNKTGVTGVYAHGDRFISKYWQGEGEEYLGTFDTLLEAAEVRRAAEIEYKYSGASKAQDYIDAHREVSFA